MFTYNITFIVAPELEAELLNFIRKDLVPKILGEDLASHRVSLKKLMEYGGEKPGVDEGLSIALAVDFPSEESAHLWNDHILLPALGGFTEKFETRGVFFITLLENLSI